MTKAAASCFFGALLALVCSATAGPFDDAVKANRSGDNATALRLLRSADQGESPARQQSGGVRCALMKQATNILLVGVLLALALFGVAAAGPLEDARTAEQRGDYVTEMALLRPLADQGNAVAQAVLGWMYEHGQGVPQDYAQALIWFRKAAEQGLTLAQFKLGLMYGQGQGVPQDDVRAHMWFNIAAAGASDVSVRDQSVKYRDLIAAQMTPAQIAEAQRLAREWKPTK